MGFFQQRGSTNFHSLNIIPLTSIGYSYFFFNVFQIIKSNLVLAERVSELQREKGALWEAHGRFLEQIGDHMR